MRILFYPAVGESEGSGHLRRSLTCMTELGEDAQLYCPAAVGRLEELLSDHGVHPDGPRVRHRLQADDRWDLIVLDQRVTAPGEIERLAGHGCLIGLDEGGVQRADLPYLIDTLPGKAAKHPPNLRALQLPAYPAAESKVRKPGFRKVLISFGGEDAAHLSERLLALLLRRDYGFRSITVVEGPLFGPRTWPAGIEVLRSPKRLVDEIPGYDLLFCSFGLTCFEALTAKVPVILLNPTALHRRLSRGLGLPEIGVGKPRGGKLRSLLARPERLNRPARLTEHLIPSQEERLPVLLASLRPPRDLRCPLCGSAQGPVLARFPRRTYVRCPNCGLVYLLSFAPARDEYGGEYFSEEYRRQYGCTYLEDFPAIKRRAAGRLALIGGVLGEEKTAGRRLLDVGGAYGAFQQAAQEAGYRTMGMDVSAESCRYVRETLGLECLQDDFLTTDKLAAESFDVLTMWFVLEHFQEPAAALAKAAGLLRPGGVFAFSTPNAEGISAIRSRQSFLHASPADHCTVWCPSRIRGQLARFGFRVVGTRVTGHHPERFPLPAALRAAASPLLKAASRLLGLGDTFEVYAVKSAAAGSDHVRG